MHAPGTNQRIAVVGAGPVGLEVALYASRLGHDVRVYERGTVGDNLRRWGHVRLFSPWSMNHSRLGAAVLERAGVRVPGPGAFLSGAEHVERYLIPLAASDPLAGCVVERTPVVGIGRDRMSKKHPLGPGRAARPFRVMIASGGDERVVEADVVFDCSGTYGNPLAMGSGNLPAPGERACRDRICYEIEDVAGAARARYAGQRVLVVGSGYSAATALAALLRVEGTTVVWVARAEGDRPYRPIPGDPLPDRSGLGRFANDLAGGASERVRYRPATVVERIAMRGPDVEVTLRSADGNEVVTVDRIVSHAGWRPDDSLLRELQVHPCYASEGPMRLAATLLGRDGGDCLDREPAGPEALVHPEPNLFVLGAKSYGRSSDFLIRVGVEQVREAFTVIEGRPDLDLYGG